MIDDENLIDSLWAYTGINPDGSEGVVAYPLEGIRLPLIASDRVLLNELRPYAQRVADRLGIVLMVVEFIRGGEIDRIYPSIAGHT